MHQSQIIILFLSIIVQQSRSSILFDQSFQDQKFMSLQGWVISTPTYINLPGLGIGAYDYLTDYAGLDTLHTAISTSQYDQIFKYYQNMPPHKAIRIKMKIIGSHKSASSLSMGILVLVDGDQVYRNIEYYDTKTGVKFYDIDLNISHSTSQLLIQVVFESTVSDQVISIGIRNFQLYYVECPNTCSICFKDSDSAQQCEQWELSHSSLYNINYNSYSNDGWNIYQKDVLQKYQTYSCNDNLNYHLFGVMSSYQKITKTIILPPHYQVNIQYSQFLLQFTKSSTTQYWLVEINDQIKHQVDFNTLNLQAKFCRTLGIPTYDSGDIYKGVNFQTNNQNTTLIFSTYANQNPTLQNILWGIRGFQVHVKKCHSSCQSCKGPSSNDCITTIIYPNFVDVQKYFDTPTFTASSDWQIIAPVQPKEVNCNGISIFGGSQQLQGQHYIQRFLDLPVHTKLEIKFNFYQIDIFNNDIFYVVLDNQIIYQKTLQSADSITGKQLCGLFAIFDTTFTVTIQIQHTQTYSLIQMYTNQPTTSTGYWGIREFQVKANLHVAIKDFFATKWTISPQYWFNDAWIQTTKSQPIGLCQSNSVLGGLNGLGQIQRARLFINNLQDHIQIRLKFTLIIFQQNNNEELKLNIQLDNQVVPIKTLQLQTNQICGQASSIFIFDDIYNHKSNSLYLVLWIDQLANIEYWGIRDVLIQQNNQGLG